MSLPNSIRQMTRRCHKAFREVQEREDAGAETREWAENQGARLRMWAATLGVDAKGRLSIAYRLRLNEPFAAMIYQLLDGLKNCLRMLSSSVQGSDARTSDTEMFGSNLLERITRLPLLSSLFPSVYKSQNASAESIRRTAACNIGLLLDIASDLRKPGTHREEQRALEFEPTDDQGRYLRPEFEQYVRKYCLLHLLRCRYAVESHEKKLAFRGADHKSAILDDSDAEIFSDGYEKLSLALGSLVDGVSQDYMLDRLQTTITQRWRLLCYRSYHASLLSTISGDNESIDDQSTIEQAVESDVTSTHSPFGQVTATHDSSAAISGNPDRIQVPDEIHNKNHAERVVTAFTAVSSAATQVPAERKCLEHVQEDRSHHAVMTKIGVNLRDADFPREIHVNGEEGICPLCWIPMPAKDLQGKLWR